MKKIIQVFHLEKDKNIQMGIDKQTNMVYICIV